jgi:predicted  nucleic acid-binding Zn-ribbon protein
MEEKMEDHKDEKEQTNGGSATTEKLWNSTLKTFHNATFKANQYKRIVQKKIDLSAVQKKISAAHSDLGKLIDDMREAGEKAILSKADVKSMFSQIDSLKHTAASLMAEIEEIKDEVEPGPEDVN